MNIAFIPARCGSKSIPFKNIRQIGGKPLIFWTLNAIEDSQLVDEVYVATDCQKIIDVVESLSFSKVRIYKRKKENAQDNSSTESVMLEFLKHKKFSPTEVFILAQATSPFLRGEDLDNAIKKFKKEKSDSLLSAVRVKRFFWSKEGQSLNYDYRKRPRRQDFKGVFMENGAFYISYVGKILQEKNRLSGKISIYEMEEHAGLELDEEEDWEIGERLIKKKILQQLSTRRKIKIFLSDVDGTLTDAGMYYDEHGNELKKFNTHDGKAFQLLREKGIKTGLLTTEDTLIVEARAKKLKVDYLFQGIEHGSKLEAAEEICKKEKINLEEVAYIGDDINCKELLERVGFAACPRNSHPSIKAIPGILHLSKSGGQGAVREFVDMILGSKFT